MTSLRFYDELARAGVFPDPSAVNRVTIEAPRGGQVVIRVELLADAGVVQVVRSPALLDGLDLLAAAGQPAVTVTPNTYGWDDVDPPEEDAT